MGEEGEDDENHLGGFEIREREREFRCDKYFAIKRFFGFSAAEEAIETENTERSRDGDGCSGAPTW